LANHAVLALAMGALSWLFLLPDSAGVAKLFALAAAGSSLLVGTGFAVRFLAVLSSKPESSIPVEPASPGDGKVRHWTEHVLLAWTCLCIAALTTEAVAGGSEDPMRVVGALANLLVVGVIAMQAVRLVRAERAIVAHAQALGHGV
jgi:hypothetical protein